MDALLRIFLCSGLRKIHVNILKSKILNPINILFFTGHYHQSIPMRLVKHRKQSVQSRHLASQHAQTRQLKIAVFKPIRKIKFAFKEANEDT